MKEAEGFQIFCPKGEQWVPKNGFFEVDRKALACGNQRQPGKPILSTV